MKSSARLHTALKKGAVLAALLSGSPASPAASDRIDNAVNVEDMAPTADGRWLIASGMAVGKQRGALHLIEARTRAIHQVYPSDANKRAASSLNSDCPDEVAAPAFAPHGLTLRDNGAGQATLYVVNHGTRESIEIFSVDRKVTAEPQLRWTGCIKLPPGTMANSVTVSHDGTVFATAAGDIFSKSPGAAASTRAPIPPAGVLSWTEKNGWRNVPTGPLALSNGILLSQDNRFLYVADWLMKKIIEVDLQDSSAARTVQVDFLPDNLRWSADGSIWVAGQSAAVEAVMSCYLSEQTTCELDSSIARLNPRTMTVSCSQRFQSTPALSSATVALQLQNELWIGSFRAQSIAIKQFVSEARTDGCSLR